MWPTDESQENRESQSRLSEKLACLFMLVEARLTKAMRARKASRLMLSGFVEHSLGGLSVCTIKFLQDKSDTIPYIGMTGLRFDETSRI
jgi:hypothetical protein